jgi:hypothetical protein
VCGGRMAPAGGAGPNGTPPLLGDPHGGGECGDCGAVLD